MDRRSLGITAIILIILMAIIATAGLDNLPRSLQRSIAAAPSQLTADRAAFDQNRAFIERAIRNEPDLFQTRAARWRQELEGDSSQLGLSAADLAKLQQLAKANRRTDEDKVEKDLGEFSSLRKNALSDASAVRAEAERWLNYKHELPRRIEAMRASYDTVKSFDIDAATAPVHKAMIDWPDKKSDLQTRLDSLKDVQTQGQHIWDSAAQLRSEADGNHLTGSDYATLFSNADHLDADARELRQSADTLNALAGQLYTSWDKLLVDVDNDNGYREKLRIVRTRFPDATLSNGQTSNEEKWEAVDRARYREARRDVGMALEHKPAGKYDSEADRAVQPPAFAYVAPPGQSNAYGSWTGGVWHWLPEYLILSHLLHASRGPVTVGDFEAYRDARRSGQIFHGWGIGSSGSRPSSAGNQSSAGWYKERPKPSFGDGAFGGSKYESRGAFSGSRFQSRGTFGARSYSRGGGGFRSFSRGGRR